MSADFIVNTSKNSNNKLDKFYTIGYERGKNFSTKYSYKAKSAERYFENRDRYKWSYTRLSKSIKHI